MGCFSSSPKNLTSSGVIPNLQGDSNSPQRRGSLVIDASSFIGKRRGQIRDHYSLGAKLGSGAFGFVRMCTHKTTKQCRAIKTIKKDSIAQDMAERAKFFAEVDILKATDHPNIVRLYEFYEDEKYYHLVTEHIAGGELFDFILKSRMLSEPIAAHFMRQILSGVAYCHSNNIVHRDLKPENLLLETEGADATLKIIDFGTSIIKSNDVLTQRYGTAYYIAPEVLQKHYNEKCDLWSCGVILYILLSGKPPFYGREDRDILRRVQKGEYSMKGPEWELVSAAAKRLISRMLDYNPKTRISASAALQDEWFLLNYQGNFDSSLSLNNLDNLKSFRAEQKMQHAVLTFIASQLLSKNEAAKLAETFRELDSNGDGKLSKEELVEAYTKQLGAERALEEAQHIMEQVDVNNSGFIDYTEFIMASTEKEVLLSKANLDTAFKAFDADGSGKISAKELRELFCGRDGGTSEATWKNLIREVDANGDGEIDLDEFKEMMSRIMLNE